MYAMRPSLSGRVGEMCIRDSAGGVTRAIEMARAHASFTTTVEIECENLDMVREAVEALSLIHI